MLPNDSIGNHHMPVIALFEPDSVVAGHVSNALNAAGLSPLVLPDPALDLSVWEHSSFDAIIVDSFASKLGPVSATSLAREIARGRPILALTPHDCSIERTTALISGADDAIYGKGDTRELVMRILALMRRRNMASSSSLICDELVIDLVSRQVERDGHIINMPLREFDLLSRLAHSRDNAVTRIELLRAVWRLDFDPGTNRIDVHMSRLRQRVDHGHHHAMLRTVKGIGYALVSRSGAQRAVICC